MHCPHFDWNVEVAVYDEGVRHALVWRWDTNSGRRRALVETGMMLAAHRILDVAILDSPDLPTTLGFGLAGLGVEECRELDALYGEGLPAIGVKEQGVRAPAHRR